MASNTFSVILFKINEIRICIKKKLKISSPN